MRAYLTQLMATVFVAASLLAPFASGWAMALGVADGRLLVICTGDGLRTIYIDENGDATQLSDDATACVLKSATDTSQSTKPETRGERLLFATKRTAVHAVPVIRDAHLTPLPRAPPLI